MPVVRKRTATEHMIRNGFSLVELIVVMAIMGILFVSVQAIVQSGSTFFKDARSKIEADRSARLVMTYLNGTLRRHDRSGDISYVNASTIRIALPSSDWVYEWLYFDGTTGCLTRKHSNEFSPSLINDAAGVVSTISSFAFLNPGTVGSSGTVFIPRLGTSLPGIPPPLLALEVQLTYPYSLSDTKVMRNLFTIRSDP